MVEAPPCHLLLLLGFTAISDHLRAREVMTGCGLQSSAAPVRVPISFLSLVLQSMGGWQVLSWARSLVLFNWTDGPRTILIPKTVAFYYIPIANTRGGNFGPSECEAKN